MTEKQIPKKAKSCFVALNSTKICNFYAAILQVNILKNRFSPHNFYLLFHNISLKCQIFIVFPN